jgi:hypothetical protein
MVGGWRLSGTQSYNTGFPIGITANATLPISNTANRPYITTDNWLASYSGSFDPAKDKFLDPTVFPAQPVGVLGNAPRENSKVRLFPSLNENMSLAKTFKLKERLRLDFRFEAFNIFNRVVFGGPVTSLQSSTFGVISSQANTSRNMQGGLKIYW